MNVISSLGSFVSNALDINKATLSGALDVIAVKHDDGTIVCTPFHVRFGKLKLLRSRDKIVHISVNGKRSDLVMRLGDAGEAYFIHPKPGTTAAAVTSVGGGGAGEGGHQLHPLPPATEPKPLGLAPRHATAPPSPPRTGATPASGLGSLPQLHPDGSVTIAGVKVSSVDEWDARHQGQHGHARAGSAGSRSAEGTLRRALPSVAEGAPLPSSLPLSPLEAEAAALAARAQAQAGPVGTPTRQERKAQEARERDGIRKAAELLAAAAAKEAKDAGADPVEAAVQAVRLVQDAQRRAREKGQAANVLREVEAMAESMLGRGGVGGAGARGGSSGAGGFGSPATIAGLPGAASPRGLSLDLGAVQAAASAGSPAAGDSSTIRGGAPHRRQASLSDSEVGRRAGVEAAGSGKGGRGAAGRNPRLAVSTADQHAAAGPIPLVQGLYTTATAAGEGTPGRHRRRDRWLARGGAGRGQGAVAAGASAVGLSSGSTGSSGLDRLRASDILGGSVSEGEESVIDSSTLGARARAGAGAHAHVSRLSSRVLRQDRAVGLPGMRPGELSELAAMGRLEPEGHPEAAIFAAEAATATLNREGDAAESEVEEMRAALAREKQREQLGQGQQQQQRGGGIRGSLRLPGRLGATAASAAGTAAGAAGAVSSAAAEEMTDAVNNAMATLGGAVEKAALEFADFADIAKAAVAKVLQETAEEAAEAAEAEDRAEAAGRQGVGAQPPASSSAKAGASSATTACAAETPAAAARAPSPARSTAKKGGHHEHGGSVLGSVFRYITGQRRYAYDFSDTSGSEPEEVSARGGAGSVGTAGASGDERGTASRLGGGPGAGASASAPAYTLAGGGGGGDARSMDEGTASRRGSGAGLSTDGSSKRSNSALNPRPLPTSGSGVEAAAAAGHDLAALRSSARVVQEGAARSRRASMQARAAAGRRKSTGGAAASPALRLKLASSVDGESSAVPSAASPNYPTPSAVVVPPWHASKRFSTIDATAAAAAAGGGWAGTATGQAGNVVPVSTPRASAGTGAGGPSRGSSVVGSPIRVASPPHMPMSPPRMTLNKPGQGSAAAAAAVPPLTAGVPPLTAGASGAEGLGPAGHSSDTGSATAAGAVLAFASPTGKASAGDAAAAATAAADASAAAPPPSTAAPRRWFSGLFSRGEPAPAEAAAGSSSSLDSDQAVAPSSPTSSSLPLPSMLPPVLGSPTALPTDAASGTATGFGGAIPATGLGLRGALPRRNWFAQEAAAEAEGAATGVDETAGVEANVSSKRSVASGRSHSPSLSIGVGAGRRSAAASVVGRSPGRPASTVVYALDSKGSASSSEMLTFGGGDDEGQGQAVGADAGTQQAAAAAEAAGRATFEGKVFIATLSAALAPHLHLAGHARSLSGEGAIAGGVGAGAEAEEAAGADATAVRKRPTGSNAEDHFPIKTHVPARTSKAGFLTMVPRGGSAGLNCAVLPRTLEAAATRRHGGMLFEQPSTAERRTRQRSVSFDLSALTASQRAVCYAAFGSWIDTLTEKPLANSGEAEAVAALAAGGVMEGAERLEQDEAWVGEATPLVDGSPGTPLPAPAPRRISKRERFLGWIPVLGPLVVPKEALPTAAQIAEEVLRARHVALQRQYTDLAGEMTSTAGFNTTAVAGSAHLLPPFPPRTPAGHCAVAAAGVGAQTSIPAGGKTRSASVFTAGHARSVSSGGSDRGSFDGEFGLAATGYGGATAAGGAGVEDGSYHHQHLYGRAPPPGAGSGLMSAAQGRSLASSPATAGDDTSSVAGSVLQHDQEYYEGQEHTEGDNSDAGSVAVSVHGGGVAAVGAAPAAADGSSVSHYTRSLLPTSAELMELKLEPGANTLTFNVEGVTVSSNLFLWDSKARIVVSDVDGTITKSDVLGHIFFYVGRDWTHAGVAQLYSNIRAHGYHMVYLTSRAIGQTYATKEYLQNIRQFAAADEDAKVGAPPAARLPPTSPKMGGASSSAAGTGSSGAAGKAVVVPPSDTARTEAAVNQPGPITAAGGTAAVLPASASALATGNAAAVAGGGVAGLIAASAAGVPQAPVFALPEGPVITSPDRLLTAFTREVILRKPQEFKIAALRDIQRLFPAGVNPFYCGFGNRDTDVVSYRAVGIPEGKIFVIDPTGDIRQVNNTYRKSYGGINTLVQEMFPLIAPVSIDAPGVGWRFGAPVAVDEVYTDAYYWRKSLPALEELEQSMGIVAAGTGTAGTAAGKTAAAAAPVPPATPAAGKAKDKDKEGGKGKDGAGGAAGTAAVTVAATPAGKATGEAPAPPPTPSAATKAALPAAPPAAPATASKPPASAAGGAKGGHGATPSSGGAASVDPLQESMRAALSRLHGSGLSMPAPAGPVTGAAGGRGRG